MNELRSPPLLKSSLQLSWSQARFFIAIAFAVCAAMLLTHLFFRESIGAAMVSAHKQINREFDDHPLIVLGFFQVLFVTAHFFLLPIHSLLCIALTVIVQDFWLGLGFCLVFSLLASSLQYLVVRKLIYDRIWHRYRTNELVKLLLDESAKHPFRVALMARMLAVPVGLKDYILALVHTPFPAYIGSALVSSLIFLTSAVSIGVSLENLDQLLEQKKPWAQKSFAEKSSVVLFFVVFLFTSSAVLLITVWTRKKLSARQTHKEMELSSTSISLKQ